jgi:aryl-alcohol dehydrogenase-like predicted oxidoreductase
MGLTADMEHFTFGRNNGLRVSALALGAGNFGGGWGYGADQDASAAIVDKFAEAGGTFIDTAASYQAGESEEFLGRILAGRRDEFTLATKFAIGGTAERLGVTPAQVSVAWLLERARRSPTGVVPIIGPRTVEQLDGYLGALDVRLDADTYDELDQVSRIPLGQPHEQNAERRSAALGGQGFRLPPVPSA